MQDLCGEPMKINEFNISDLFRAGTGDWPGDAAMAKELAKNCSKATPGEILKMIKQAKELRRRGQPIDLVTICGDKLDPQVAKKLELQQKHSPEKLDTMRQKQDILRRQRKNKRKQDRKKTSTSPPTSSSQADVPPDNARLPTKSFGDLIWNGTAWLGPAGLRFSKPEDIKKMHNLYFQWMDADRREQDAERVIRGG